MIRILVPLLLIASLGFAQQKTHESYKVKEGETLRSIARNHEVSVRYLLRLNPGLSRRPKANTIMLVPVEETLEVTAPTEEKTAAQRYLVKPKETLYGIARRFGIDITTLKAANPLLNEGLKIGMELQIPLAPKKPLATDTYQVHEVVKGDTFFGLTRKYGLTEQALYQLNPELSEGLQLGMLLKIRLLENTEAPVLFAENPDLQQPLRVALMLPYQLHRIAEDSIRRKNFEKGHSLLSIVTDFHMGAAMAIDSLRTKGYTVEVDHYDTENSVEKLQYLVNHQPLDSADLVIGPLFYEKAHWLSNKIKTPVIAPFYSKKQAAHTSPNLLKSAPDKQVYEDTVMQHLNKQYQGANVLVINDEKPSSTKKLLRIVDQLKSFDSIQDISVLQPEKGFIEYDTIFSRLDSMGNNWVLLITDEVVTTAAAVNNLKAFAEDYRIRLFAFEKGKNFENIENSSLGSLGFTYATNTLLDTDDIAVANFFDKYRARNHSYPSDYAIKGFDITYDVLLRLASAGDVRAGLGLGASTRLMTHFDFRERAGILENKGVRLIHYTKDLRRIFLE